MFKDKDKRVILYLIKNTNPSTTLLFKLLFLCDVDYYRKYKKKITSYEYIKYNFGAFAQPIYFDLAYLDSLDVISCKTIKKINIFNKEYEECKYTIVKDLPIKLDFEEEMSLKKVINLSKKYTLKQIKNIVYGLPMVKEAKFKEVLDFSLLEKEKDLKIRDLEKYNSIIKKLRLNEPVEITEDYSKDLEKEYYSRYENIKRANREILSG
jgi:hypothetical protein